MGSLILNIIMILFSLLIFSATFASSAGEQLHVYDSVPGLDPSPYFSLQVRQSGDEVWTDAFTLITECTSAKMCDQTPGSGIWEHLTNWSNSYINFEMEESTQVQIKITKLWGDPITKAVVHPASSAEKCEVRNGHAIVTISKPSLFTVDVNGQMDDQDTGMVPKTKQVYDGPPIHTVTIFANPFLDNKPSLDDEGVLQVTPGEMPPEEGSWHTLYFLPGLHDIGHSFTVHQDKSYYIPGDAVVYGTMGNMDWGKAENATIFGHGTLSGEKLPHPSLSDLPEDEYWRYRPLNIAGAYSVKVVGISIINSAFHSILLSGSHRPEEKTEVRWVKIFTWRANGDGINPFKSTLVEDCFIRTQDDSIYVNGHGIKRTVFWQDSNGSTFVLSSLGGEKFNAEGPIVVEDCTVVYARAHWHHWSGGSLFNMRGEGGGEGGYTVTFRNILVEDPRPTLQHFKILMEGVQPWSDPADRKRDPGDLWGITFEDVSIRAPSVMGEPEVLWGMEDGLIRGLQFRNVTIGGQKVEGVEFFQTNEFVFN